MIQQFEKDYAKLISEIYRFGEKRETRNGITRALFGKMFKVSLNGDAAFPILQYRKMYPRGVFGELAAILRKPIHIHDFHKWGCNYWDTWADKDGFINVDYGNAWFEGGQIERLKNCLANNPTDRRMIISGWRPHKLQHLSLPCCHLMYQFYVRDGKYLDMAWSQRSVDTMVGLPSDIIFAAAWLIALANEFDYIPGEITMFLGDCHIYDEHIAATLDYLERVEANDLKGTPPTYIYIAEKGKDFLEFEPNDIALSVYQSKPKLELELKA